MEAKKKKILIVEDEAVMRESVRDWLIEKGYEVECVETGEGALERIKEEEFGVIVLDLRLPGIDGLEVYEQAKDFRPETQGIMITAYPSKETREKAKRLGLLDYLDKPFKVEDLLKIIRGTLGEVEKVETGKKRLWLELGAVSFRLCTHDYECGSCAFAQEIQDKFGTIAVIGEDEVAKLRQLPGSQRLCRYTALHFARKESPRLD